MNGTAHVSIGAATGFIVANSVNASPATMLILVGLGGVSGLMPDLDVDGKLRSKVTFSHKVIKMTAQLIGVLMIIYSIYEGMRADRFLGIGIGVAMLIISSFLKQKHMLIITGIGVIAGALTLKEMWLLLLGIYIIVASFVSHRSYTHSILGVIYFGVIAAKLETSLAIDGAFAACLAGYIGHLIADSKFLPVNKRGVKIFLPFSSKDF
ncbi:metal-dependent hydrolase [Oceanobacillus piezotolerans]|uniref:Metal-dependent hydrolase n=1 Tax=Oceanobacillus piezotolerans TaxID=2448030 RepID=A0A498D479_9BACI|nr:metal-dependent hydrolase [Oceanobacillus piezotolerans]RLL41317.1 metal-dependent hydrolase [Oceanobacillus piezotolerans]